MRKKAFHTLYPFLLVFIIVSCGKHDPKLSVPTEDKNAKAMLEGVWLDADENTVTFRIKGDTIYYPDTISQPVEFKIIGDTMVMYGSRVSKYPVVKQTAHLFEFKNLSGDVVRLVKSDNPNDIQSFMRHNTVVLNQNKVIKRDTVVAYGDKKYHCYVQINPTTYKVYRPAYNEEGLEVENVYYDNIIHVSIFSGASKMFSKDFKKDDFAGFVPKSMMRQSILSDIRLVQAGKTGIRYQTQLAVPDSPSSFIVELTVAYDGNVSMQVTK